MESNKLTFFLSVNVAYDVAKNFKVRLKIPSVWDAVITPSGSERRGRKWTWLWSAYDGFLTISSANSFLPPVCAVCFRSLGNNLPCSCRRRLDLLWFGGCYLQTRDVQSGICFQLQPLLEIEIQLLFATCRLQDWKRTPTRRICPAKLTRSICDANCLCTVLDLCVSVVTFSPLLPQPSSSMCATAAWSGPSCSPTTTWLPSCCLESRWEPLPSGCPPNTPQGHSQ